MDRCPFSVVWVDCELFDRHRKWADEVSVYFQLELDEFWFLSVPMDKNLKD